MTPDELTLPSLPANFSVVLFGLECVTTRTVLKALVTAGIKVSVVCLPGRSTIPLLKSRQRQTLQMASLAQRPAPVTVTDIALGAEIDVWRIGDLDAEETQEAVTAVDADLLVVACYNRLIPAAYYEERRYGGINLHPSLLPDKRGPDPLFWVFRQDDRAVGASIHRLTQRFDAGEILGQSSTPKPDGIGEADLDAQLAGLSAQLLLQVIVLLASDSVISIEHDEHRATYAPHPVPSDYHLSRDLSARQAFNFFHGIAERGHPVTVDIDGQMHTVTEAHSWTVGRERPGEMAAGARHIKFSDGWLSVTLADPLP